MFRIVSGDIAPDYSPVDNLLMAKGRPSIIVNKITLLDFELLDKHTEIRFSALRSIIAFLIAFVCIGFYWALAVAFFMGIYTEKIITFRMRLLRYGTFIASADEKSYLKFAKAVVA